MSDNESYVLESEVIEDFESRISDCENPFDINRVAFEFNYISGRTDIIGESLGGDLVAFEAKLSKWREALNQAYRNSSFANYSYVLLPKDACKKALEEEHEFVRRGVGLCSISGSDIRIEIKASWKKPLQPWLKQGALKYIVGEEGGKVKASIGGHC